ncbi:ATP-binding cassette domain-containing protein [Nocardioides sp. LHD-245]|uniref:ATP-binding cassette domain-containing protein n=1 Tax=Nocardioides sp. LHD-245 TaxID=3051387 RepID=UPI0027E10325|nr:ATP-binding cassette domain-containing protein [Nocardioides sp. LHD-245]
MTTDAPTPPTVDPLLSVRDLEVNYGRGRQATPAVRGVSFDLQPGETLGLVGESGSGKSTIARAVLGLTPVSAGRVSFLGRDLTSVPARRRGLLTRDLQVVFQDPYSSLNPTRTIGQSLAEMLRAGGDGAGTATSRERIAEMLERVGLPADAAQRYPAAFSGGQRQRIAIARALMTQPRLVVCDEAVSALDVSVQAQVLNLLRDLQRDFNMAYLFIAHDLPVVRNVSHRIAVIHRGRFVEQGPAREVYERPRDPYTQKLLSSVPIPNARLQRSRRATSPAARTSSMLEPAAANGVASPAATTD